MELSSNFLDTPLESTELKISGKISDIGNNNRGVFSVGDTFLGHPGEDLIVKVVDPSRSTDNWSEVKALNILGELIASGSLRDTERTLKRKGLKGGSVPVIVMERKKGVLIEKSETYKTASKQVRKEMMAQVRDLTCSEVADIAVATRLYHE